MLKNIHSGWEKISIYLFKLEVVLNKFTAKTAFIKTIKNKLLFKELSKLVLTAYNWIRIEAKLKEVIVNVFNGQAKELYNKIQYLYTINIIL